MMNNIFLNFLFACDRWQVTLCDAIQQATPRSSVMEFHRTYHGFLLHNSAVGTFFPELDSEQGLSAFRFSF